MRGLIAINRRTAWYLDVLTRLDNRETFGAGVVNIEGLTDGRYRVFMRPEQQSREPRKKEFYDGYGATIEEAVTDLIGQLKTDKIIDQSTIMENMKPVAGRPLQMVAMPADAGKGDDTAAEG